MATAKKKRNAGDGLTLGEFRAWLAGIEEMQESDWAPNLTQWQRIKAKLAEIVEEEVAPPVKEQPLRMPPAYEAYMPLPSPAIPYNLGTVGAPGGTSLDSVGTIPAPRQPLPPGIGGFTGNTGSVKTPDIDSSNGYQSSLV